MEKKLYAEPLTRVIPLAIQDTMLTSTIGTGSDLNLTGDYKDDGFDDLFN